VVSSQGFNVVLFGIKDGLLDSLTQAVFSNSGNDLAAVVLFGVDPTDDLVEGLQVTRSVQFSGLDHGLANGDSVFRQLANHCGIVKDSAGNLAVSTTKTKDQVKSGFLLDVIIRKSATIFQLLSSEDKTLLIRWNSFLVLDLGFDVVNGVGWFDVQCDGLSCQGLYENLYFSKGKIKRERMN